MPTHKRLIISIVSSAAEKIIHKCCHWQPLITLSQHSKTHKTSYPLLAIFASASPPAAWGEACGSYWALRLPGHHGVSVSVWSASVWRPAVPPQTDGLILSLAPSPRLPPANFPASLLVVFLNVFAPSLLVFLVLFLSVLPVFLCLSAVGVLTVVFSPYSVGFHTASSGEARLSERVSRREGGCCLSLSFSVLEVAVEWRVHSRYVSLASSS